MKLRDAGRRYLASYVVMGLLLLTSSGCSVFMAAKQPDKKDLSVLDEGAPRSHVAAELGTPVWSGEENGRTVELF
ncbi:MAG: hypothetical protein ACE5JN_14195 [Candidatus Methylomirabilia bacterium]